MVRPFNVFVIYGYDEIAFFHASKLQQKVFIRRLYYVIFRVLVDVAEFFININNILGVITWASEPESTAATITGASPRTLNPNPASEVFVLCSWILLGTVQWCFAEKMATGPRRWNKSSTGKWAKSGGVNDNWNLDDAAIGVPSLAIRKHVENKCKSTAATYVLC